VRGGSAPVHRVARSGAPGAAVRGGRSSRSASVGERSGRAGPRGTSRGVRTLVLHDQRGRRRKCGCIPIERNVEPMARPVGSCRALGAVGGNTPSVSTRGPRGRPPPSAAIGLGDGRIGDRRPIPLRHETERYDGAAGASGSAGRHAVVPRGLDVGSAGVRPRFAYGPGLPPGSTGCGPAAGPAVAGPVDIGARDPLSYDRMGRKTVRSRWPGSDRPAARAETRAPKPVEDQPLAIRKPTYRSRRWNHGWERPGLRNGSHPIPSRSVGAVTRPLAIPCMRAHRARRLQCQSAFFEKVRFPRCYRSRGPPASRPSEPEGPHAPGSVAGSALAGRPRPSTRRSGRAPLGLASGGARTGPSHGDTRPQVQPMGGRSGADRAGTSPPRNRSRRAAFFDRLPRPHHASLRARPIADLTRPRRPAPPLPEARPRPRAGRQARRHGAPGVVGVGRGRPTRPRRGGRKATGPVFERPIGASATPRRLRAGEPVPGAARVGGPSPPRPRAPGRPYPGQLLFLGFATPPPRAGETRPLR
jgi:hypothetical protein